MFLFFMLYHYFNAFWRLSISAWVFWGGLIIFWGLIRFCWKPQEFFGVLSFGPIRSSPSLEIRGTSPPNPPWDFGIFQGVHDRMPIFLRQVFGCSNKTRGRKEGRKSTNDNIFLPIEMTIAFIWLSDLQRIFHGCTEIRNFSSSVEKYLDKPACLHFMIKLSIKLNFNS